jgi:outer membrane protein OmpA-like peptidoglycan-associated protein
MSSALVSGITEVFRSQVAGPFASNTNESETSVIRGFETGLGTMVGSLAAKLRQSGFASQLIELINSPANDPKVLENPRSLVASPPGDGIASKFTAMLFGGRYSDVTDEIGSATGIRGRTAAALMSLGAPLLLGTLRKRVRDTNMDASRLTGFLANEAEGLRGSLPTRVEHLVSQTETREIVPPIASALVEEKRSGSWIVPVLLGILLLAGLLWWFSTHSQTVKTTVAAVPEMVTRSLPGNVNLQFPANRIEDNLLRFIQDPSKAVDQATWFEFDRLLFDTNSATLQSGSSAELANIAAILKAYPNVHVRIGGFTDSTGDPNANMVLSQQRADTVSQQLIGMGISSDRIEAQGYTTLFPEFQPPPTQTRFRSISTPRRIRRSAASIRLQAVNCLMAMTLNAVGITQLAEPGSQGHP